MAKSKQTNNILQTSSRFSRKGIVAAGVLGVAFGIYVVLASHAASAGFTPLATLEVEGGTVPEGALPQVVNDTSASGGKYLQLSSGNVSFSNIVLTGNAKQIVVRAKAQSCDGAPQIGIKVNNVEIAQRTLAATNSWQNYFVNLDAGSPAPTAISLAFTNAYQGRGCTRQAMLDQITVMGESAAPSGKATAAAAGQFFPSSFFHDSINTFADLAPTSSQMVAQLRSLAGSGVNYNQTALYEVPSDQPTTSIASTDPILAEALHNVPLPGKATPGPDGRLIVWQESSDTAWELGGVTRDATTGAWSAKNGGVIRNAAASPGYYRDILAPRNCATQNCEEQVESHTWGSTPSGIALLPGLVTASQASSGHIGHAIVLGLSQTAANSWAYPAQTSNGSGGVIPQGTRLRLDPSYDLSQVKSPYTRMIAEAAQRYGVVITGANTPGITLYGEGPKTNDAVLQGFPWERMQALSSPKLCTDKAKMCLP